MTLHNQSNHIQPTRGFDASLLTTTSTTATG